MSGPRMDRRLPELERDLGPVVGDWLRSSTEPLPERIKREVIVQAAVISQRGRWPWQRRSPRLRVDTLSLAVAPAAALVLVVVAAGITLLLLGPFGPRAVVEPVPAATPSSPSPTLETTDLLERMITEPVEAGVVRLVDDGAGHDVSTLREFTRGPYWLTAAPDGSVWLSQSGGDGTVIGFGVPGSPRHPMGPGTSAVAVAADGRLWVANDAIASWDGSGWIVHDGPPDQVAGGAIAAHPDDGIVAAYRSSVATEFMRLDAAGTEQARPFAEPLPPRLGDPMPVVYDAPTAMEVTRDGLVWLIELMVTDEARVQTANGSRTEYRREPARLLRSSGGAWEQVHPLGDGVAAEPREMVPDPAGRLVVRLGESVVDPDRLYQIPVADEVYGDREWIVRWEDGEWQTIPSHDGSQKRPERLIASGLDSVWLTPPWHGSGGSGGIVEYRADGTRRAYLDGIDVHDALVTPDGRTWVAATASSSESSPSIYIITPHAIGGTTAEPVPTDGPDAVVVAGGPGTFGPAGSLMGPRRLGHSATLLPDGRIAVIGGDSAQGETLGLVEIWDPKTSSFAAAGSLVEPRLAHTATALSDGRVLVVGGFDWERAQDGWPGTASTEAWDPDTGASTMLSPLVDARLGHTATPLLDGRVLVVGGAGPNGPLASAEIWDPESASFSRAGSLGTPRIDHTATLLPDGSVLVIGGDPRPADAAWLATAETWEPATATFEPAGSLSARLDAHTATLLPDGRVLVVGLSDVDFRPRAMAAIWDPGTRSFAEVGPLSAGRTNHTATLLPDGRVLVAGGTDNRGRSFASAELWDPATDSFTRAGPLAGARTSHSATELSDGRVLVIGGSGASSHPLASAEAWTPGGARIDATAGYVLETVEPGVQRLVDDGAGHSSQDLPTYAKWLYKLTSAPDGTLWLPRTDDILHLGEAGFVENPIGPGALELEVDAEGDLWIRNGRVLTPDGVVVGERRVESDPRIVEMVRHPVSGVIASITYPDDRNELRHWTRGMEGLGELLAPPLPSDGQDWFLADVTVAPDGAIWAIESRYWFEPSQRLPSRLLRTDGSGWEVVPLADVGVEVEPWSIAFAPDGRLFVDLAAVDADPGRGATERLPIHAERAVERWLTELAPDGDWRVTPIPVSEDTRWQAMAGVTRDGAWFPLGDGPGRCRGVGRLSGEEEQRYLVDQCVYSMVVAPDERVWVTASDAGGAVTTAALYAITPTVAAAVE